MSRFIYRIRRGKTDDDIQHPHRNRSNIVDRPVCLSEIAASFILNFEIRSKPYVRDHVRFTADLTRHFTQNFCKYQMQALLHLRMGLGMSDAVLWRLLAVSKSS